MTFPIDLRRYTSHDAALSSSHVEEISDFSLRVEGDFSDRMFHTFTFRLFPRTGFEATNAPFLWVSECLLAYLESDLDW